MLTYISKQLTQVNWFSIPLLLLTAVVTDRWLDLIFFFSQEKIFPTLSPYQQLLKMNFGSKKLNKWMMMAVNFLEILKNPSNLKMKFLSEILLLLLFLVCVCLTMLTALICVLKPPFLLRIPSTLQLGNFDRFLNASLYIYCERLNLRLTVIRLDDPQVALASDQGFGLPFEIAANQI